MMKKRSLLLCLALVLSLTMAIGGTLAYLTDTDTTTNVMVVGNVDIEQTEWQRVSQDVVDGDLKAYVDGVSFYPAVAAEGFNYASGKLWTTSQVVGAVDKLVQVENVGKSDAYFRTLVAFQQFAGMDTLLHINWNDAAYTIDQVKDENGAPYTFGYEGKTYVLYTAVYPTELKAGEKAPYSLLQVALDGAATNSTVKETDGPYSILVATQAIQTENFKVLVEQGSMTVPGILASQFGNPATENSPWAVGIAHVSTEEAFYTALNNGQDVVLDGDITLNVPYINLTLGTADATSVTIDGNGHTITFNNGREEVWISTTNPDAVLNISNAKLGRSNPTVGNYLTFLSFYGNTNLTNVEFHESVNLWGVAKEYNLTDVRIIDSRASAPHYAMFIKSGSTVTLEGCVLDNAAAGNRAIKVSDVNAEEEAQAVTTLTVKNTTFASNKKAAILVGTKYGAKITLENVDISQVAADSTHAVWVEDVYASYADTIEVTGGAKDIEK